jgi:hypothetical protein
MIVAVDGAAIGPPPGGIIAELGGENESDRGSRHRSSLHLMKNVPMLNIARAATGATAKHNTRDVVESFILAPGSDKSSIAVG